VFSPERNERLQLFYAEWKEALDSLAFDGLSREAQADAALFENLLRGERSSIELSDKRREETAALLPFAVLIIALDAIRRRMERPESPKCAAMLDGIAAEITAIKKTLTENPEISGVTLERAARTTEQMRDALGVWFRFYDGYDPIFSWWMREPYQVVDTALSEYVTLLREKSLGMASAEAADSAERIAGDPIGAEALQAALDHELIPYSPDELIAMGDREFAWCEAEMRKASQELGFGDSWRDALEMVKDRHVEPGEQPVLVRELAEEAIAFLEEHDLVTVPPLAREVWRMVMMSSEAQKTNPFFLGGETIYVSFPTVDMSQERKRMSLRGNNRHFARATVQHELIPGHHLQFFVADRYRTHRQIFGTPFYVEGWTIHWEFLLWKRGFPVSPEDRIGMLFWRMHRCARVAFSLRYHLGLMSAAECVEMLVERVGHERENALAEVRRSLGDDYPPLYQAAYLLGGLQMHALYEELVESGQMTPRAFHDTVLQRNCIPIPLLRAELIGLPIPQNLTDLRWRFYEQKKEIAA
jgi:hypothetical protein